MQLAQNGTLENSSTSTLKNTEYILFIKIYESDLLFQKQSTISIRKFFVYIELIWIKSPLKFQSIIWSIVLLGKKWL